MPPSKKHKRDKPEKSPKSPKKSPAAPKSPKTPKSPLLQSGFDQTTFLPPQLELGEAHPAAPSAAPTAIPPSPGQNLPGEFDRYQVFINEANSYSHVVAVTIAIKGLEEVVYTNLIRHQNASHMEDKGCADCNMQVTKLRIRDFAETMRNLFETKTFPVPLLYDTKEHKVVSSDSSTICRFLNSKFEAIAEYPTPNLFPDSKKIQKKMLKVESRVLELINVSIGKAGRASNKDEFETAAREVQQGFNKMEKRLGKHRFLCGPHITEPDILEFVALFRYDPLLSYVLCEDMDKRVLLREQYPNIWGWLKDIYQHPGVADTCDLQEILASKSFLGSLGARLIEMDIQLEPHWDQLYHDALMERHGRGGEEEEEEDEEEEPVAKKQK